ncbi:hypothetical protein D3C76_912400 [compost metagenome]
MLNFPPSIAIKPFVVSASFVDLIPSPPAFIVMFPELTATKSLPTIPLSTDFTSISPPVIFKSSLVFIPLL